jgi:hypothetical protein
MVAEVSVTYFSYFAPIIAFFLVFLVISLVLLRTKVLGDNKWMIIFVSFVIATLFISAAGARRYVEVVTPWFAVLFISLFFMLLIVSFAGKVPDKFQENIGIAAVIMLVLIFFISAIVVFSDVIYPYLPGGGYEGNLFTDWLYSGPVVGAIILIVVTAVISWLLVKK